jgi:TRAP-type transport system periplasmic protein
MKFKSLILIAIVCFIFVTQAQAVEMIYSSAAPEKTPWVVEMKIQAERIGKLSGGEIKAKLYTGGVLGDEIKLVSSLRRGRVHAAYVSSVPIGNVVPEFEVVSLPFIWESVGERDYVFDKYLFDAYTPLFEKAGLKLLAWSEVGSFVIGSKKRVVVPDDNQGLRYRAAQTDLMIGYVKSIGAKPIDIPIMETTTSVQTGLVDGVTTTMISLFFFDIYKNIDFITLTESCYAPAMHIVSRKWFNRLSKAQQKAIMENSRHTTPNARSAIRKVTAGLTRKIAASGVELIKLSPQDRTLWKNAVKKLSETHLRKLGPKAEAIFALILKGKEEYAQGMR